MVLTTGRLLVDILAGHQGPGLLSVSSAAARHRASWPACPGTDSLKIWDALETNSNREAVELVSEGSVSAGDSDGQAVSVSSPVRSFTFSTLRRLLRSVAFGQEDLRMGKGDNDKISANKI